MRDKSLSFPGLPEQKVAGDPLVCKENASLRAALVWNLGRCILFRKKPYFSVWHSDIPLQKEQRIANGDELGRSELERSECLSACALVMGPAEALRGESTSQPFLYRVYSSFQKLLQGHGDSKRNEWRHSLCPMRRGKEDILLSFVSTWVSAYCWVERREHFLHLQGGGSEKNDIGVSASQRVGGLPCHGAIWQVKELGGGYWQCTFTPRLNKKQKCCFRRGSVGGSQ